MTFEAPVLEVARLVASASGFHVDLEPGAGNATIIAKRGDITIKCGGKTADDAADSLIRRLTSGQ